MIRYVSRILLHLERSIFLRNEVAGAISLLLSELQIFDVAVTLQLENFPVTRVFTVETCLLLRIWIAAIEVNIHTLGLNDLGGLVVAKGDIAVQEVGQEYRSKHRARRNVEIEDDVAHARFDIVEVAANHLERITHPLASLNVGELNPSFLDEEFVG